MINNNALRKLIDECDRNDAIILYIDYIKNIGLIECSDGTPTSIIYDEKKEGWI